MCRMVGVVFRGKVPLDVLHELREVSKTSKIWDGTQGHRDGWGIASYRNESPYYLDRQEKWAYEDPRFEGALERAAELDSPGMLIAHVRAASQGPVSLANTHPFIVDGLIVGHNGTLKGYNRKTSRPRTGDTDSELLALVLADRYEETGDLRTAMKSVIREDVDSLMEFPLGTVLVVTDGKTLCGYRDFSEHGSYYDLRIATRKDCVVLYQETNRIPSEGVQVGRRELVSVDINLRTDKSSI